MAQEKDKGRESEQFFLDEDDGYVTGDDEGIEVSKIGGGGSSSSSSDFENGGGGSSSGFGF
jgi:hypothetical protein